MFGTVHFYCLWTRRSQSFCHEVWLLSMRALPQWILAGLCLIVISQGKGEYSVVARVYFPFSSSFFFWGGGVALEFMRLIKWLFDRKLEKWLFDRDVSMNTKQSWISYTSDCIRSDFRPPLYYIKISVTIETTNGTINQLLVVNSSYVCP